MISILPNESVRGRLLRIVALIVLPLTAVSSFLAYSNHAARTTVAQETQARLVEEFAFRTRLWYRGLLRVAEVLSETRDPNSTTADSANDSCIDAGRSVRASARAIIAVVVHRSDATPCIQLAAGRTDRDFLYAASMEQLGKPSLTTWGNTLDFDFRYDSVPSPTGPVGLVQARRPLNGNTGLTAVTIMVDMQTFDAVFEFGAAPAGSIVGLLQRSPETVLGLRGIKDGTTDWLPADAIPTNARERWQGVSRNGTRFTYTMHEVIAPDIVVLAAFPTAGTAAATLELAILGSAPLLLLCVFAIAFWRLVDRDFGRTIESIESAARRASLGDFHGSATVEASAPLELRRASDAVNQIIQSAIRRQEELETSLQRNGDLMRELHHRVKNSLQVIQSYLAITRRRASARDNALLQEAEIKVFVLSIAYRYALTDGGLQPVRIRPFVLDLFASMQRQVRPGAGDGRELVLNTTASLEVDRIIPLGLAITEVVFAAANESYSCKVTVHIVDESSSSLTIRVSCPAGGEEITMNESTLRGLRLQLGAKEEKLEADDILRWTIEIQPPRHS